jgi:exodeoxyribonuclease I
MWREPRMEGLHGPRAAGDGGRWGDSGRMAYVFYDTETSGISTAFDQILQIAAIRTDEQLKETDRFNLRCRLSPYVIPHPAALRVTGMSIEAVSDPALPCHYEMMREVHRRFTAWSPATFIGYNSLAFDEHLLRQALFRTLHPPYLTNSNGNRRADALSLVQAASVFAPECLTVPVAESGRQSFKLDRLAPENGFSHENAHDALADVEATIHLARCVRDSAPGCWDRLVRFSAKAEVEDFARTEQAFLLTEFYYNRPYHMVVSAFGAEPAGGPILCLNLNVDMDWLGGLPEEQLARWVAKSPKPVRRLRANAAPCLTLLAEAPDHLLGPLTPAAALEAARRLRSDRALRGRLVGAVTANTPERAPSEHVEERIYDGFIPNADLVRMSRFHAADWPGKARIVEELEDDRLRYHGRRIVHEVRPDLLHGELRSEIDRHCSVRHLSEDPDAPWTTLAAAIAAIDEMSREDCDSLPMLRTYRSHLDDRIRQARTHIEGV